VILSRGRSSGSDTAPAALPAPPSSPPTSRQLLPSVVVNVMSRQMDARDRLNM
jgi:hypothetical protein